MTVAQPWNALVLAGGRSSRMGRDKALLPWDGQPLLLHMRAMLSAAGANRVVLSGHHPLHGAVADREPGRGPMAALAQIAPVLEDGAWIIVPVDMPQLRYSLIDALLREPGVCASVRDHPLPMCLMLDDATRAVIARVGAMEGRRCSFRNLHEALSARILDDAVWRDQLANCNTPEQWQALVALSTGCRSSQDEI